MCAAADSAVGRVVQIEQGMRSPRHRLPRSHELPKALCPGPFLQLPTSPAARHELCPRICAAYVCKMVSLVPHLAASAEFYLQ